jgi:hypothetical protein
LLGCGLQLADAATPVGAPFPKVRPEQAFADLKVYGADSLPWRVPQEDWAGARQRATEPSWQKWVRDQRASVDDWMSRRQDRPEWVAGWWHDFVSPKDGSFLVWTPEVPGEETLASRSDPKVRLTPKLLAAWVFGFRSRHVEKMVEAAHLFRLTGEPKYGEWAASQLDFYATNYLKWPIQTSKVKARLMHQSLDDATLTVRLVTAARLLEPMVTPARKQLWLVQLLRREAALLEETFQSVHNIACWHRAAAGMVALYGQDEALWQQAVKGPYGLRRQIADGVTSDYFWFEQSLGYNSFVVAALTPFFKYAAQAGRTAELRVEIATVENLMLAPLSIRFPNGQLPNPADVSGGPGHAPNLSSLAGFSQLYPTPAGLAEAARQKSWTTLLDPPRAPAVVPPLPPVTSHHLESTRSVLLRRGPWQVYLHYGQVHPSHAQAEALNFELCHGDTDLSHDPGTVGYGSPLHRGYYTTGLSHNVPLIDGLGQEAWQPGECLVFDPAAGRVAARQSNYRKDASVTRELRLDEARLVDVVKVQMATNSAPRKLGLVLHVQGKVTVPPGLLPEAQFATGRPVGFSYWKDPRSATFRDRAVFEVLCGKQWFRVTFQVTGPFRLTHASAPDSPPRRRDAFYLETTGREALFTTTVEPLNRR